TEHFTDDRARRLKLLLRLLRNFRLQYNPLACTAPRFSTILSLAAAANTASRTLKPLLLSCERQGLRSISRRLAPPLTLRRKCAWLFATDSTPSLPAGVMELFTMCFKAWLERTLRSGLSRLALPTRWRMICGCRFPLL